MESLKSFFTDAYDEKPIYKTLIEKIVAIVDNGIFFRQPLVYFYRIIGVLILLSFFVAMWLCFSDERSFSYITYLKESIISVLVFLVVWLAASVFGLLYWINRSNKLRSRINTGSDIVVMPLIADSFQCLFEWYGLTIMIFCPIFLLYFGLFGQLFLDMRDNYFFMLFCCIGISSLFMLSGYCLVLMGHFIGENIRAVAIIANNVKDLGDIHRAALMPEETPETEETNKEEE